MKKTTILLLTTFILIFSCKKDIVPQRQIVSDKPVDDNGLLMPPGGYSKVKRPVDYLEQIERGKPIKGIGTPTLTTKVVGPYEIDVYASGSFRGVQYYEWRTDDAAISQTAMSVFYSTGLEAGSTHKYECRAVSSSVVGNWSAPIYATTTSIDQSQKIILFLQFNNDTITDPHWTQYNGGLPIITGGSGFTDAEMQTVTDGVTYDFSAFTKYLVTRNVDVYNAADVSRRLKTCFAQNNSWYQGAGGVAYLNGLGQDICSWVFSAALYYNTSYNRLAGSHENGHNTAGCHHSVDSCGESYGNDGEIMGAPYGKTITWWSYHLINTCGYEDHPAMLNSR